MNERRIYLKKLAILLVALMALLQGFYAIYGYFEPAAFTALRGTDLIATADSDRVKIYASRTLFVALIIGYLLYKKDYITLMWAALLGAVMPITDGLLAFEEQAPIKIILKHAVTLLYLIVTALVLKAVVAKLD